MKWQLIETAPKDGEWLIVYYPLEGVGMASWYSEVWLDWDGDLYGPPTHWMPLPEPPSM